MYQNRQALNNVDAVPWFILTTDYFDFIGSSYVVNFSNNTKFFTTNSNVLKLSVLGGQIAQIVSSTTHQQRISTGWFDFFFFFFWLYDS